MNLDSKVRLNYILFLTTYLFLGTLFYHYYAEPYSISNDLSLPKILADSLTFQSICGSEWYFDDWRWLRDIGPCTQVTFFEGSFGLITITNILMLLFSSILFSHIYEIEFGRFFLWMLINPMTFLSLFGPNKEIFGLTGIIATLLFLRHRTISFFLLAILLGAFSRLAMLLVVIVCLMAVSRIRFYNTETENARKGLIVFSLCLVVFSFANYFFGSDAAVEILDISVSATDNSIATYLSLSIGSLSSYGLFAVVYLARLVLNLYSAAVNIVGASVQTHGIYYVVGVVGSSIVFLALTLAIVYQKKYKFFLSKPGVPIGLSFIIYTCVYCSSPVVQHRYFFPLYPIFVLCLLFHPSESKQLRRLHLGRRP